MAVTHKRQFAVRDPIVWVFCYRTVMPWKDTRWRWCDVTCKNCLARRPKGKR